jgi:hypothetical protein
MLTRQKHSGMTFLILLLNMEDNYFNVPNTIGIKPFFFNSPAISHGLWRCFTGWIPVHNDYKKKLAPLIS